MTRKLKLNLPRGDSPDWESGRTSIDVALAEAQRETIQAVIEPFVDEYGGDERLISLVLTDAREDSAQEEGAERQIAAYVLQEDLLVLELDLESKLSFVEPLEDGFLVVEAEREDPRQPFARASRLIEFCLLDDAVGFEWQFV